MHNLRQFLDLLRREGELVTVDAPVSAELEIAEIHRRVLAAAGPALLFTHVEGADFSLRHQPLWHGSARRFGLWP